MFSESSRLFPPPVQLQSRKVQTAWLWGTPSTCSGFALGGCRGQRFLRFGGQFRVQPQARWHAVNLVHVLPSCEPNWLRDAQSKEMCGVRNSEKSSWLKQNMCGSVAHPFNPALCRRTQCTQRLVSGVAIAAIHSVWWDESPPQWVQNQVSHNVWYT